MLALRLTPKLKEHPLSAVRDCLLNIFAATLRIEGRSFNRNLRKRHAVVSGTHVSRNRERIVPSNNPRRNEGPKLKTAHVRNAPHIAVVPAVTNSSGQHLNFPRKAQTACANVITRKHFVMSPPGGHLIAPIRRMSLSVLFSARDFPGRADNVSGPT